MVTKDQVIDLHRKHPDWYAAQIAEALGCESAYVRSTARRYGLNLPKGGNGRNAEKVRIQHAYDLGSACLACGFTLADILDFSEERERKCSTR